MRGGAFLQSKEWEELQSSRARAFWRVPYEAREVLVIRHDLPLRMSYLYCPAPPIFDFWGFAQKTKDIAQKTGAIFLKVEPMIYGDTAPDLARAGFRKSRKEVQPQETRVLDLAVSEDILLAAMHQKTRYNIGLAKKHGVSVRQGEGGGDTEIFLELLKKTSARDAFSPHPDSYYRDLLSLPFAKLFVAERQGYVLAAHIVVFYEGTATYLHGASDYGRRRYMAPYLLQWETIRQAKEQGYNTYDFWGISSKKWPGVTRFKRGFGGKDVGYTGSYDYAYKKILYAGYLLKQNMY